LVHSSSAFKKTARQPDTGIALEKPPPPFDEAKFSLNQPAQSIEIRINVLTFSTDEFPAGKAPLQKRLDRQHSRELKVTVVICALSSLLVY
jgi:hypothetical protein